MKRISLFLALMVAGVALLTTSCGTSDYLESLTLSSTGNSSSSGSSSTAGSFYNLVGLDGTLQLIVTANYHSGKTIVVTNNSTWTVKPVGCAYSADDPTQVCQYDPVTGQLNQYAQAPYTLAAYGPNTVPISSTGMMTAISNVCTWEDLPDTTVTPVVPWNPAEWVYTGYYQVTATYRNFTSQPVGIGVGVTTSNAPAGGCGPS